jgi:hypothetical protein
MRTSTTVFLLAIGALIVAGSIFAYVGDAVSQSMIHLGEISMIAWPVLIIAAIILRISGR